MLETLLIKSHKLLKSTTDFFFLNRKKMACIFLNRTKKKSHYLLYSYLSIFFCILLFILVFAKIKFVVKAKGDNLCNYS